ncbi:tRNA threonylcarbamoyladenosine biosynthesis protein TsaB, partial [Haemophilus influenzae]
GKNYQGVNKFK